MLSEPLGILGELQGIFSAFILTLLCANYVQIVQPRTRAEATVVPRALTRTSLVEYGLKLQTYRTFLLRKAGKSL